MEAEAVEAGAAVVVVTAAAVVVVTAVASEVAVALRAPRMVLGAVVAVLQGAAGTAAVQG
jgi:hypothetical protein